MEKIIETERLYLRNMTDDDFNDLCEIFMDVETMKYYPSVFNKDKVQRWINWNKENYEKYNFGLWSVCLKSNDKLIGDCGITLQNIDDEILPEIGYHINKKYQQQRFGHEAALAVRDWAFNNTKYDLLYSYCKYNNVPSYKTAESIGMKFLKEYKDPKNEVSHVSAISRAEWEKRGK